MRYTRESLNRALADLAAAATAGELAHSLAAKVNHVAEIEGWLYAVEYLEQFPDPAAQATEAAELLLRGADDTWSGRRNDVARARFDGLRDGVRFAMDEARWRQRQTRREQERAETDA